MNAKALTIGLVAALLMTSPTFGQRLGRPGPSEGGFRNNEQARLQFHDRSGFDRMGMGQRNMGGRQLGAMRNPQGFGGAQMGQGLNRGPARGGQFAGQIPGRIGARLQLTPEQRDVIQTVLQEHRQFMKEDQQAVRTATRSLHETIASGDADLIAAAGQALADAITGQALGRAAAMQQIAGVLTEEQRMQAEELKSQMRERMQQFSQGRRDNQDGKRQMMRRGRDGGVQGPEAMSDRPQLRGGFRRGAAPINPM